MEVRGERRCKDCDTHWSYYETGSVACPDCGSVRSVGVSDRQLHTDRSPTLDLDAAREAAAADRIRAAGEAATDSAGTYIRKNGFIDRGDLKDLDDTILGVYELREVGRTLSRELHVGEREERYFTDLLMGVAEGARPPPSEVPPALHAARGLAVATAVEAYLDAMTTWLERRDDQTIDSVTTLVGQLKTHRRRITALDGDVPPEDSERLVTAVRATVTAVQSADSTALDQAHAALDAIS